MRYDFLFILAFILIPGVGSTCGTSCSERPNCRNCTQAQCMWCLNLNTCIDRNAYLASFPYGQCMDWTTETKECPAPPPSKAGKNDTAVIPADDGLLMCSGYSTCDACRTNPACGWCDDGSLTGVGSCMPGGASNPMRLRKTTTHGMGEWVDDEAACPRSGQNERSWHFTSCPACQCHGHSNCSLSPGRDVCAQPCGDHTEGDHCEKCSSMYFGDAVNGGTCEPCKCNGNAAQCDHRSGRCHCTTKGIIGDHCEKCDKVNHYDGDPVKDSCFCKNILFLFNIFIRFNLLLFYFFTDELAIDYQFTFNLSKVDDRHFTAINFKNTPSKMDVDVDFQITCSVPSKVKF